MTTNDVMSIHSRGGVPEATVKMNCSSSAGTSLKTERSSSARISSRARSASRSSTTTSERSASAVRTAAQRVAQAAHLFAAVVGRITQRLQLRKGGATVNQRLAKPAPPAHRKLHGTDHQMADVVNGLPPRRGTRPPGRGRPWLGHQRGGHAGRHPHRRGSRGRLRLWRRPDHQSLIFKGKETERPYLLLVSGTNRVNEKAVGARLGEAIVRPDADFVRITTRLRHRGVSPIGHTPPPSSRISTPTCCNTGRSGRRPGRRTRCSRLIRRSCGTQRRRW